MPFCLLALCNFSVYWLFYVATIKSVGSVAYSIAVIFCLLACGDLMDNLSRCLSRAVMQVSNPCSFKAIIVVSKKSAPPLFCCMACIQQALVFCNRKVTVLEFNSRML